MSSSAGRSKQTKPGRTGTALAIPAPTPVAGPMPAPVAAPEPTPEPQFGAGVSTPLGGFQVGAYPIATPQAPKGSNGNGKPCAFYEAHCIYSSVSSSISGGIQDGVLDAFGLKPSPTPAPAPYLPNPNSSPGWTSPQQGVPYAPQPAPYAPQQAPSYPPQQAPSPPQQAPNLPQQAPSYPPQQAPNPPQQDSYNAQQQAPYQPQQGGIGGWAPPASPPYGGQQGSGQVGYQQQNSGLIWKD
ncbi:hypothetical protein BLS_008424 [Venturia inaequalis]|uniref:Uncharacterized protein n=1 Tax=Venturia inaequalis TaxID=5025 RepID=A0A8H3YKV3_VENIN|nr:hypothetical protein BLS_008424 [Venturia inaequalis]